MENIELCKGGCGSKAVYAGWCGIKWKIGNKVCIKCPKIEERRGKSISRYRIKESKLGLNPMQNPIISKKNHSIERNKKASETLKKLGNLKLLPQQTESKILRERRLKRIRKVLRKLANEGKLSHQIEPQWKKDERHKKISKTLKEKFSLGLIKLGRPKKSKYNSLYNGKIYLKSKWELRVARFLDINKIKWHYEPFVVKYLDSEKNQNRGTVPDFYLPDYNLLIEVKGFMEKQKITNTKDKIKGLNEAGYNTLLWGSKEIEQIKRKAFDELLNQIKDYGDKNA